MRSDGARRLSRWKLTISANSPLVLYPRGRRQGNRRAVSPLSDPIQACGGRLLERRAGPKRETRRRRPNSLPTSTPTESRGTDLSFVRVADDTDNCQGKVESSAFEQSRMFRFGVAATTTRDMFDPQRRGRAWCCCPKPRRRGRLRSNRRMPSCDAEPVSLSGAPGGHCRAEAYCFGETPERRLWA